MMLLARRTQFLGASLLMQLLVLSACTRQTISPRAPDRGPQEAPIDPANDQPENGDGFAFGGGVRPTVGPSPQGSVNAQPMTSNPSASLGSGSSGMSPGVGTTINPPVVVASPSSNPNPPDQPGPKPSPRPSLAPTVPGASRPPGQSSPGASVPPAVPGGSPAQSPALVAPGSVRSNQPQPQNPSAISFAADVAPILRQTCSECHHPGTRLDLSRFPFVGVANSPEMVRKLIDLVSTQDGRTVMPPAPRDRLSPAEIDLIRQWQSQGMAP